MTHNPYQSPQAYDLSPEDDIDYEYAGFWIRAGASIIDNLLYALVTIPIFVIMGSVGIIDVESTSIGMVDYLSSIIMASIVIFCWIKYAGTPGKRLLKLKVLDANTGENISVGQAILRYIGYIPSIFVLFLGLIWVAFDKNKQGWHDKIAKTVVVREL
ncbi:RDD family protein [Moraxella oblonga]|uniref:RDD family protein n=1 Tax=Moraxella oblonga TaxID=200413 RepID=UPI0009FD2469|nr:RDD family protein [Moraxella oblonga]